MSSASLSSVFKWVLVAVALAFVLVSILPVFAVWWLRASGRNFAVERLERRFDDVELDELTVELAPGWGLIPGIAATGSGLSVSLPGRDDVPPFITMNAFTVDVGLLGLLRDPIRIRSLRLDQLEIQIPPERDQGEDRGDDGAPPGFVVEELEADGAVLRILREPSSDASDGRSEPGGDDPEPLQFDLHQLRVDSAGLGEPMVFDAVLDNAKPPGEIRTEGSFGPLILSDVGASPVSGEYVFQRAKLHDFGGIAGTLYSEGEFTGILSRIDVQGFTETPDFQLTSAAHPMSLRTDFDATVDGTNGDTFLTPVNALLGESRIATRGGVFERSGTGGKTVCLDAVASDGRIEDFLQLAMSSEPPLMTGDIRFRSLILIPPGEQDVVGKLVLDGELAIDSAEFPERKIQEKVDDLSEAGRGKTDEKTALDTLRDERVLSDIRGEFELDNGVMTLSALSFSVPGASVTLEGTYGLLTKEIDFLGELRLDAKVSETTTGIKSLLLKLLDPLLNRGDSGAVIPIKIGGTSDQPSFGPDLGRVITREEVAGDAPHDGTLRKPIPSCSERLNRDLDGLAATSN